MFHPDEETLAAVALGDDAGLGDIEHVRSCAQCSATVSSVEQTVALARVAAQQAGPLAAPPPGVWSRIESAIDATETHEQATVGATPDVRSRSSEGSAGTVHSFEAAAATVERRRSSRRPSPGWGAGLAAAGIAIGLLTGRALWQEPAAPSATTIATAGLDTLDTQRRLGDAALLRTAAGVDLQVATAPLDPGDGFLEVWLINTDGKRMISVGVLRGQGPETFPVSQTLIDEGYVIVDISREGFDDRPEHSGDSLVRGTLPT